MTDLPSFMASYGETLIANGYSIIPIKPGTKIPGRYQGGEWHLYPEWQRHCERETRPFEHDIWQRWPGCAIGLACGRVIGIDIDILTDPALAIELDQLAREMLGDTPAVRIGNAPKRALYYRAHTPFAGRKRHPLEVYGLGSQMVIYAVHPVTGRPYEWPEESLTALDVSRLPEITEAQAMAWLDAAYARVPAELRPNTLSEESRAVSGWSGPSDPVGTLEAVTDALAWVPNDDLDGSSWIRICNAIKAALGPAGRELWLEWSKSASKSGASGKTDTAERRWASADPTSVGAGTIYYLAEQRGWVPGSHLTLNGHNAERADAPHPAAGLIAKAAALVAPTRAKAAVHVTGALMDVGGVMGDLIAWSVATAKSPQPFLALGAALCCVGAAAGRKYRSRSNLRTNIYVIGIADSGGGKEQARTCSKEALFAAGLGDYLGGEEIASGTGLLASLKRHPSRLFQIDEIGKFLATTNSAKAQAHKAEIWTNLTKLYTSAGGVYLGTEYADQDTRPRIDIHQPCCSLYGVTVPGRFWAAIEGGALTDGSIARCLVFLTDCDYPDRNKRPAPLVVPEAIVAGLQAIAAGAEGHEEGNLAMLSTSACNPYEVPISHEADAIFDQLEDDQTAWLRQMSGTDYTAIIARFAENVNKVAMIKAISDCPQAPVIQAADAEWAKLLVEHCIRTLIREAGRFVADNETEANLKYVLDICRRAGTISKAELNRRTQKLKSKERDDILNVLIESCQLIVSVDKSDKAGRPSKSYTATSFG